MRIKVGLMNRRFNLSAYQQNGKLVDTND